NILIIGCSIAGPALATCLLLSDLPADQQPHITVLERSPGLRTEGQNIDIRGAGITIIRRLGIEKQIKARTTGEEGVRLVDMQNRIWAQFSADKSGKMSTPTADVEILRGTLAEILYQRARTGIEFIWGDHLDSIEQDGDKVDVHFAKSGQRRRFDLVVGADGLQSTTRGMVWGQHADRVVKKLAGGVYGAFFSMAAGQNDTMWRRWFHAPGRRGVMVRPDEQRDRVTVFMTLINDTDERLSVVATNRREEVQAQKQLMKEFFQDAGWECDRIVDGMMKTKDFYYDMIAQVKMDNWSKGRVALLGDAGYCASPFSGMGTTLGLTGAWNLAGAILQHPNDHGRAFAQYEEKMRPTVELAHKLAPGMPNALHPQTSWGVWILN
ncbi:FAD/NAD(P)-binding domain-containing protein, partial [Cryphonectria parasitica EP155]